MAAAEELTEEVLGPCGRMVAASKTDYRDRHPDHVVVFNANVCVVGGKLWYGDLDLTIDEPLVRELANRLGEPVFVLYEYDGRFKHEAHPLLTDAVYGVMPGDEACFDLTRFVRAADGSLRRLPRRKNEDSA